LAQLVEVPTLKVTETIPDSVIGIILPSALRPWDRLSLYQRWVPGVSHRCKGGRCI